MAVSQAGQMMIAMNDPSLVIETRGLTKHFGRRPAVVDLDLAVPRGCAFGFLGHNGAGKTTLIRMLVGLTEPDAGTIRIAGRRLPEHRQDVLAHVGAIIEEPRFHAHLTGRENLGTVAAVRGPQAHRRIEPALARVGLSDRADHRVGTYSQGMRQRLGIARCLLADPELVILDEPMNGLDPGGILELRQLIADMVAEGRTVFVSSHLLDEIEKTCHAAAVIDKGRLVWQGAISELVTDGGALYDIDCDDPRAARDLLAGHAAVTQVRLTGGGVRVTLTDPAGVSSVNARLIEGGIAVSRSSPVRVTLEDRFLQLTSHLGGRP
jgi:ABC-2 type transport system ATP-binding protein